MVIHYRCISRRNTNCISLNSRYLHRTIRIQSAITVDTLFRICRQFFWLKYGVKYGTCVRFTTMMFSLQNRIDIIQTENFRARGCWGAILFQKSHEFWIFIRDLKKKKWEIRGVNKKLVECFFVFLFRKNCSNFFLLSRIIDSDLYCWFKFYDYIARDLYHSVHFSPRLFLPVVTREMIKISHDFFHERAMN